MTTHTISFCILDDLRPAYGPIHETFEGPVSKESVEKTVQNILQNFLDSNHEDPSDYYQQIDQSEINSITTDLCLTNHYVINRFNKYYVIAFSLDYTRFEIFSKDCDKELITWRYDDLNDPITGIITDEDYNVSPVIKMLQLYQGYSNVYGLVDGSEMHKK
jgi:hypothetical protein